MLCQHFFAYLMVITSARETFVSSVVYLRTTWSSLQKIFHFTVGVERTFIHVIWPLRSTCHRTVFILKNQNFSSFVAAKNWCWPQNWLFATEVTCKSSLSRKPVLCIFSCDDGNSKLNDLVFRCSASLCWNSWGEENFETNQMAMLLLMVSVQVPRRSDETPLQGSFLHGMTERTFSKQDFMSWHKELVSLCYGLRDWKEQLDGVSLLNSVGIVLTRGTTVQTVTQ